MSGILSFDGRIGRGTWWVAGIILGAIQAALYVYLTYNMIGFSPGYLNYYVDDAEYWQRIWNNNAGLLTFVLFAWFALSVIGLSVTVRRWHDLNKSGWWVLINLIPVLGSIYAFVMQGFVAGDQGPNQYGPAPGQGGTLSPSQARVVG